MSCKGFVSCCGKGSEIGFDGRKGGIGDDRREGMGFISHHEIEEGLSSYGMRAVIVDEFSMRNHFHPCCRVTATEYPKVHFDFLVYTLSFFSVNLVW
jgi:hypothetical protein